MAQTARRSMSVEEFLDWQQGQDFLYELVDGVPVPLGRRMTGASVRHDLATVNILASLGRQLRGTQFRPTIADLAIRSLNAGRRPNITVIRTGSGLDTDVPIVAVDIVSSWEAGHDPSSRDEFFAPTPPLVAHLRVETLIPRATLFCGGGVVETYAGLQTIIPLPAIGASLALADVYEGLDVLESHDPETGG